MASKTLFLNLMTLLFWDSRFWHSMQQGEKTAPDLANSLLKIMKSMKCGKNKPGFVPDPLTFQGQSARVALALREDEC